MLRRRVSALLVLIGTLALLPASGALADSERRAAVDELVEGQKLNGSRSAGHALGRSVDISADGRVLLVGGDRDRDTDLENPGAAWVFVRSGSGWREAARLEARTKDYAAGIWDFGTEVALSAPGTVAVVGAPGVTPPIVNGRGPRPAEGSAWVFTRGGGATWVGTRLPIRGAGVGRVGESVAVSDDGATIVVGAEAARRTLGEPRGRGAVWIFTRTGSRWKQTAKLVVKQSLPRPTFGSSVALSANGRTLLVGGDDSRRGVGAVWIFVRAGSAWKLQGIVENPLPGEVSWDFGRTIAVSADGRTALVGARSGGGVLLLREGARWVVRGPLQPEVPLNDYERRTLGLRVALSGDGATALVSALDGSSLGSSYSVFVFKRASARTYRPAGALIERGKAFWGSAFALAQRGNVAVVGREAPGSLPRAVAVYASGLPLLTRVGPGVGPEAGGTVVTITGENFRNVSAVRFGAVRAASFAVDSPTKIRAAVPPGRAGYVPVTVTNSVGISAAYVSFRYVPPPFVEAVEPSSGPTRGGTRVRILGRDLGDATAVRFGPTPAVSFFVVAGNEISAVSPPGQAGRVTVTVSTPFDTSPSRAEFTYVSPETVIGFDELSTGGRGELNTRVTGQYAAQGVTFDDLSAIDYAKGFGPLQGFARSGSIGLEGCIGVELCTVPLRGTFASPRRLVRVWVGISGPLGQQVQVRLTALTAGGSVVGTASATLAASAAATPIRTPLEVSDTTAASIARFEVAIPGGTNNGLAIDDVTFDSG